MNSVRLSKGFYGRSLSALPIAQPAFARQVATSDSDIVVKARQRLQDVGLTVTAIGAEMLANRRIATQSVSRRSHDGPSA